MELGVFFLATDYSIDIAELAVELEQRALPLLQPERHIPVSGRLSGRAAAIYARVLLHLRSVRGIVSCRSGDQDPEMVPVSACCRSGTRS